MALQETVTSYEVSHLKNDVVSFRQVVRLTTATGHRAFIGFQSQPPAQWLVLSGNTSNVFLPLSEFDRIHHTLQSESPVFYTAINLIGIRAFNLSTGAEAPGEGPADDDALVRFMVRVRQEMAKAKKAGARASRSA